MREYHDLDKAHKSNLRPVMDAEKILIDVMKRKNFGYAVRDDLVDALIRIVARELAYKLPARPTRRGRDANR